MKLIIVLWFAHALVCATIASAGTYKVHYSIQGSGRDIIVQAETSDDARYTVQAMIPGSVVTGVSKK